MKQAKAAGSGARWEVFLLRGTAVMLTALVAGWLLHRATLMANGNPRAAGFAQGVLHGALMPLALPRLLLGRDVNIYALNNTGRTYKIGYTTGVNGCGAVFFGVVFWRVSRFRRRRSERVGQITAVKTTDAT